jgi:hypothetical protein
MAVERAFGNGCSLKKGGGSQRLCIAGNLAREDNAVGRYWRILRRYCH